MRKISRSKLVNTIIAKRKEHHMTQAQLANAADMNRSMIGRLENGVYTPSLDQLEALGDVLGFELTDLYEDQKDCKSATKALLDKKYHIAVAGTGYVGLSIATLLAQHNHVTAVDIVPEKVEMLNQRKSPIQDEYIEQYLAEKNLDLTATLDGESAYRDADYVVIAAPTNYDSKQNFFDCSAVEAVIELVLKVNPNAIMVIKSTIPVGYTERVRAKYQTKNIIFSPEFLRESKALYDNLYPSRIIVSCDESTEEAAHIFAKLLQQGAIKQNIDTLYMGFTEAEAVKLLVKDLSGFVAKVNKYNRKYGFSQNEFDALVSFCYNVGNIDGLTKNGTRTKAQIADKFLAYSYSGGKFIKGLYNRRVKERNLFNKKD